jgi:hypothetical protein
MENIADDSNNDLDRPLIILRTIKHKEETKLVTPRYNDNNSKK